MTILDTHVLVWWLGQPDKLSKKAKQEIDKVVKSSEVGISTITIWEICMLVKKNRLKLTMDLESWIDKIEELPFLQFIPVDNKIALKSVLLNDKLHQDPADRIIIATALTHGAKLVTSDTRMLKYKEVQSIW